MSSLSRSKLSGKPHTSVPKSVRDGTVKIKGAIAHNSHATISHKKQIHVSIPSHNAVPANLLVAGGQVDFQMKAYPGHLKHLDLQYSALESGRSNLVTVAPVPFQIDEIEIRSENGAKRMQTIHGEDLAFANALYSDEEASGIRALNAYNASFVPTAISAGARVDYSYPLNLAFCSTVPQGVWMGNTRGFVLVRVNYLPSVESGSGTCAVDPTSFRLLATYEVDTEEGAHRAEYARTPQMFNILEGVLQSQGTQALASGVRSNHKLSSLVGDYANLHVVARASKSNASAGRRTFANWTGATTFELLDPSNKALDGDEPHRYDQLRYIDASRWFPSSFYTNIAGPAPLVFTNPIHMAQGSKEGLQHVTAHESIRIVPGSAFTNGSYELDLFGLAWRTVTIRPNGTWELQE